MPLQRALQQKTTSHNIFFFSKQPWPQHTKMTSHPAIAAALQQQKDDHKMYAHACTICWLQFC
jgi:hypothetical protein